MIEKVFSLTDELIKYNLTNEITNLKRMFLLLDATFNN
tara:strand:+ start:343 stop:456 length:114 start_codon:yes stop_codon:yes gene_type:complete